MLVRAEEEAAAVTGCLTTGSREPSPPGATADADAGKGFCAIKPKHSNHTCMSENTRQSEETDRFKEGIGFDGKQEETLCNSEDPEDGIREDGCDPDLSRKRRCWSGQRKRRRL